MSVTPEHQLSSGSTSNANFTNVIQLSKPFVNKKEISTLFRNTLLDDTQIRSYKLKKKEAFQFLVQLISVLKFPTKILQNCCYYYQRFFLFNAFSKFGNSHIEVAITSLFISLKLNDYIKKLSLVLSEANKLRGLPLSSSELEEQRKRVLSFERKFLEFEAFDFRNFLIEELIIKLAKRFEFPRPLAYLAWSLLNDLYLTELTLQAPSNFNSIVVLKSALLIWNELHKQQEEDQLTLQVNEHVAGLVNKETELTGSINELLEYYLESYENSFFKQALIHLNVPSDSNHIINNIILNIKIELYHTDDKKHDEDLFNGKRKYDQDLYFKIRDYEIGKTGSIRFMYSKKFYMDELQHFIPKETFAPNNKRKFENDSPRLKHDRQPNPAGQGAPGPPGGPGPSGPSGRRFPNARANRGRNHRGKGRGRPYQGFA